MAAHQARPGRRTRRTARYTQQPTPTTSLRRIPGQRTSGQPGNRSLADRWPLEVAEDAFTLLAAQPYQLSVDGAAIGHGMPRRPIGVGELRVVLLHPATSPAAREAVWRHILQLAATKNPAWTIAAVGLAMPGLKRLVVRLGHPQDPIIEDASAAMLAGFLTALRGLDPHRPEALPNSIAGWLCWRAFDAGKAFRDAERRVRDRQAPPTDTDTGDPETAGRVLPLPASMPPPATSGHPDFVLARAVTDGVITTAEADLIGRSRLERVPMQRLADELGVSHSWACRLRKAAEARLVDAIRGGDL